MEKDAEDKTHPSINQQDVENLVVDQPIIEQQNVE